MPRPTRIMIAVVAAVLSVLAGCAANIALWRDRYTPAAAEANERLANFPYLASDSACIQREPGRTPWIRVAIGAAALGVGFAYHETGRPEWQTMIFTSLALLQVFQALATRSTVDSLRTIGLRSNPVMLGVAALVVALQLAAMYTPLNGFLDLEPLGAVDLAICFALGIGLLAMIEAAKANRRAAHSGYAPPVSPSRTQHSD